MTPARRFTRAELASLAGAELWVLPNPSGLNAHETPASPAAAYRAAAVAAGVIPVADEAPAACPAPRVSGPLLVEQ